MSDPDFLLPFIPMVLFACIAYAIKAVVDARVRRQMVETNGSQDLVRSILEGDELRRRHGSLRWGVVLVVVYAAALLLRAASRTSDSVAKSASH